jgi:SAM-dependent methyltransferase
VTSHVLSAAEVLAGYDAVAALYPSIPSLLMWRSWEYAAYRRFPLAEPTLDVGCGDGRFFRLIFPHPTDVVGLDADPAVVEAARNSGVYRQVHLGPADQLPFRDRSFASAFANCSLEHMDHLSDVLRGICRTLQPGGTFLFSVVTDRFVEWAPLPLILRAAGADDHAESARRAYEAYHHLVNPLPADDWASRLDEAGFDIIGRVPIVPEWTARLFLFVDQLWHLRAGAGECGDVLEPNIAARHGFVAGFREVLTGVLQMEQDLGIGAGAVFHARRRS